MSIEMSDNGMLTLMQNPTLKAWSTTIAFSAVALWVVLFRAPVVPELVPQIIFYAVLVLNTFFSVRLYSKIQPQNLSQMVVDGLLVVTYIALALSLGRPAEFALFALCLFFIAPFKYALMLRHIPYESLLRRKIKIDVTGAVLCAVFLAATLYGYGFGAAWAFAITFSLANVYLLFIRPMYRLP